MKGYIKYFKVIVISSFLFGCQEKVFQQLDQTYVHNFSEEIQFVKFAPLEGGEGTEIVIDGDNFTSDLSQVKVLINGNDVPVLGVNKKRLIAKVPAKMGSGVIKIIIGDREVESQDIFIYTSAPLVSTLTSIDNIANFNFRVNAGMSIDSKGNIYVADVFNNCIRKISADGIVSTYAGIAGKEGNIDGNVDVALFNHPTDITFDDEDNMYVADTWNWAIRKVTTSGEVSTVKGWVIPFPQGIAFNKETGSIYTASALPAASNGKLVEFTVGGKMIEHTLPKPFISGGIAMDMDNNLVIADNGKSAIYRVNTRTGATEVIAGLENTTGWVDGVGDLARFQHPWGVAVDNNNNIYVAGSGHLFDSTNVGNEGSNIRMIEHGTNKVTTIAGGGSRGYNDGLGGEAKFSVPSGIAIDKDGVIYVLDRDNNCIRKIVSEK